MRREQEGFQKVQYLIKVKRVKSVQYYQIDTGLKLTLYGIQGDQKVLVQLNIRKLSR